jgi:hypothetical protein
MICHQVKLRDKKRHKVDWIDKTFQAGDIIQFADEKREWLVEKTYHPYQEKNQIGHKKIG